MSLFNSGKSNPTYFAFANQLNLAPDAEFKLVPVEATDPQGALWFAIEYFDFGKEISVGDQVLIAELDPEGQKYGPFCFTGEKFAVKKSFLLEVSAESITNIRIGNDAEMNRSFYYKLGWKNNPYHSNYNPDIFKIVPAEFKSTYLSASACAIGVLGERPECKLLEQKLENTSIKERIQQLGMHKKILILLAVLLCISIALKWPSAFLIILLGIITTSVHLLFQYYRKQVTIKNTDLRRFAFELQECR